MRNLSVKNMFSYRWFHSNASKQKNVRPQIFRIFILFHFCIHIKNENRRVCIFLQVPEFLSDPIPLAYTTKEECNKLKSSSP